MDNISLEFIALFAIGIPTALVGLIQFMVSRYGSGSKALALAVEMQATINTNYKELSNEVGELRAANRERENKWAEERGTLKAQIANLESQLEIERENNKKLTQDMETTKRAHNQDIARLKAESDEKIKELSDKLDKVQSEMDEIKQRLEKTEKEKEELIKAKAEIEQERDSLEQRVNQIQRDMDSLKTQYEDKISTLERQIADKNIEILNLRKKIKENASEQINKGTDSNADSAAGDSGNSPGGN